VFFFLLTTSTAAYPRGFLELVGAPDLPETNPEELGDLPGDDDDDDDEEYVPEPPEVPLPAQLRSEEQEEEQHMNEALLQQIDNLANDFSGVSIDMSSGNIPIKTFYAPGVKVKGFDRDAVTNALGVVCFLGAGSVLSSLDVDVEEDKKTIKVKGHAAPELSKASCLLPGGQIFSFNPTIYESMRQAVQNVLNETEVDDQDNPLLKGQGVLPKKCTGEVLPLYKLYLAKQKNEAQILNGEDDDFWLIHKVKISAEREQETVPAYVLICFFLEDLGVRKKARKSITRLLPDHTSLGVSAPFLPPSPMITSSPEAESPNTKRRREEAAAVPSDSPEDAGSGSIFSFGSRSRNPRRPARR